MCCLFLFPSSQYPVPVEITRTVTCPVPVEAVREVEQLYPVEYTVEQVWRCPPFPFSPPPSSISGYVLSMSFAERAISCPLSFVLHWSAFLLLLFSDDPSEGAPPRAGARLRARARGADRGEVCALSRGAHHPPPGTCANLPPLCLASLFFWFHLSLSLSLILAVLPPLFHFSLFVRFQVPTPVEQIIENIVRVPRQVVQTVTVQVPSSALSLFYRLVYFRASMWTSHRYASFFVLSLSGALPSGAGHHSGGALPPGGGRGEDHRARGMLHPCPSFRLFLSALRVLIPLLPCRPPPPPWPFTGAAALPGAGALPRGGSGAPPRGEDHREVPPILPFFPSAS